MFNNEEPNDLGEEHVRRERGSSTAVSEKVEISTAKGAKSKTTREKKALFFGSMEKQLQTLVQAIPDIIYFKDVEGRNLIVNKAFEKLVGLRREEIIGKTDEEIFPSDLAKQCRKSDEETLKKGKPLRFEEQMIDEQGQTWFFETIKSPMRNKNGKIIGLVGVSRNITNQKKTELAHDENKLIFNKLLNLTVDPIVIVDRHGKILEISANIRDITGYAKEELVGKNFLRTKVLPTRSKAIILKNLFKRLKGEEIPSYEIEISAKDGSKRYAEVKALRITYAGEPAVMAVFHDITEHKKIEGELAYERDLLHVLMDNVPDRIYFKDAESHFTRINRATARRLGVNDPGEALGKTDFDFYPGEYAKKTYQDEQKIMRSGQPLVDKVEELKKNGQTQWASATKVPVKNEEKRVIGLVGISRDITERKLMEEALRESEEKYRTQFEAALDAILIADAETGVIINCNNAASELVGREKSELIGKHQRILHPPGEIDGEFSRTFKQHLKEQEGQVLETQVITKKGEIKDVAVKANVFELQGKKLIQGIFRDITEHKGMEEKLAHERDLLEALMDNIPDAIYFKDAESRFMRINREHARWMGVNDPEKVVGKTDFDFYAEEFAREAYEDERKVLKTGQPLIGRIEKIRTKDGKSRWASATKVPVKNEEKRVIGLVGISRDITERKLMEDKLASERDLLQILIDNIPDPIFFKDTKSRFLRVNKISCPGLGVSSPEEAVGMTDFDFSPKELAKQFYADDQKVIRTGKPLVNKEEVMIDKVSKKWHLVTKVPIKDKSGKVTGLVGIARNITELKETEEKLRRYSEHLEELVDERTRKLRESEERYRDLIENEKDIIYSLSKEGIITFASPATVTTLNYRPEELIGKNFMELIPEDWRKKTWSDYENLMRKGEMTAETVLLSKDGERRFVEYSSTVLKDGDKIVGTQGIVRDVTKRKQLEERLLAAERLAGIGETAAMVGHDLRNPLQAITMAIDMLKDLFNWSDTQPSQNSESISLLPEDVRNKVEENTRKIVDERAEMINIISDSVSYANKIVSNLQDYARPLRLNLTSVKLQSLLEGTLSIIAIPDNVKVILKIPEDFPEITVDPELMKRTFSNLATNAYQAMPNGGKITITAIKTNETALIYFQDTGVGIPKDNIPKLFKPLFTTKAKGQGFGLAVCKHVIEAHSGKITVESKVGKGSTFIIQIPIKSKIGLKSDF